MASRSETGHAKNLANFKELITVIKSFGDKYNPIAEVLKIPAMENLTAQAEQTLGQLKEAETLAKQSGATLMELFKPLSTLCSQVMGLLKSSGAKPSSIEEAKSVQKLITGSNSRKKTIPETEGTPTEVKSTRSQSRQSYDSRLDNFEKFVTVLQNIPEYRPNEDEFKIGTLQSRIQKMKQSILEDDQKELLRNKLMHERNTVLYTPETGLVDIGLKVKEYIKGIFGGVKSVEYRAVSKISLKNFKV